MSSKQRRRAAVADAIEQTAPAKNITILNPRAIRAQSEVMVVFSDGSGAVRARKDDVTKAVFDGRMSPDMLSAVMRMVTLPPGTEPSARIAALGKHGEELTALMRSHAANVCLEPRVSLEDTANPDVLPVGYFTLAQLMEIWSATAIVAPTATVNGHPVVPMTPREARAATVQVIEAVERDADAAPGGTTGGAIPDGARTDVPGFDMVFTG